MSRYLFVDCGSCITDLFESPFAPLIIILRVLLKSFIRFWLRFYKYLFSFMYNGTYTSIILKTVSASACEIANLLKCILSTMAKMFYCFLSLKQALRPEIRNFNSLALVKSFKFPNENLFHLHFSAALPTYA